MKILIFSSIIAICAAGIVPYGSYDDYYGYPQPYNYGYQVAGDYGGNQWKQESSDGVNAVGSYGYTDPYGLYREVNYVADQNGFQAQIKTNEPGTSNQNPADVYVYSDAYSGYGYH